MLTRERGSRYNHRSSRIVFHFHVDNQPNLNDDEHNIDHVEQHDDDIADPNDNSPRTA